MKAIILIKDALIKGCTRMLGSANLHPSLLPKPGNQTQFSSGILELILVQIQDNHPPLKSMFWGWAQRPSTANAEAPAQPIGSVLHTAFPAMLTTSTFLGNSAFKNNFRDKCKNPQINANTVRQTALSFATQVFCYSWLSKLCCNTVRVKATECCSVLILWQFHHRSCGKIPKFLG